MAADQPVANLTIEGDVAVLTLNSPPVNALSQAVREGILNGVKSAVENPAVKAVVLICDGKTFIAGADITEFGKPPRAPGLKEAQDAIENASKPVIAAIHGTALGGGLEVALCCHYRVAVPSAKCGLPEVNLGLLPGAGGTQRLPRIVGAAKALEMMTSGHMSAPSSASRWAWSMRSCLRASCAPVPSPSPHRGRESSAEERSAISTTRWPPPAASRAVRRFPQGQCPQVPRLPGARVQHPLHRGGGEPAVRRGLEARTRKLFMELMQGTQSAAQRYVFFAERAGLEDPRRADDTPLIPVKKVGIIGAGTMGGGIAMNFANVGIPVTGRDQAGRARRGLGVVRKNYENTAKRGRLKMEDVEKRMGC
jgi:3-hydroxyacyl-CoA dehydrogenase